MRRALVLVSLATGLWGAACGARPPALPPPGPNAQPATFESTPPGAQVIIDGVPRGATPLIVKLDPGRYRVRVTMSAYFPEEQVVTVPFGEPAKFQFSLIRSH